MFAHFLKDLQTEHASIVVKPTRDYKVNFECMFSPFSVVYSACYSVCGWLSALLFKRFTKWAPKCAPKSMQCHLAILIEVALCTSLNQLTCWRRCFYLPSLHHSCTLFLWLFRIVSFWGNGSTKTVVCPCPCCCRQRQQRAQWWYTVWNFAYVRHVKLQDQVNAYESRVALAITFGLSWEAEGILCQVAIVIAI